MTIEEARNDARENTKPTEDQKHRRPAPLPAHTPDAFGFIPGDFIPGEGL